jgi:hypothetical protein
VDAGRRAGRALVASPLLRSPPLAHAHHTLIHLDGIAWGSLLALGMHTLPLSRRAWLWMGWADSCWDSGPRPPSPAAQRSSIRRWPSALPARCWRHRLHRRAQSPLNAALRRGPLAFYGRISYGLYMIHIMVFIYFGWFDAAHGSLRHSRQPGHRRLP